MSSTTEVLVPSLPQFIVLLVLSALTSLSHTQDCPVWITVDQNADTEINCATLTGTLTNRTCSKFQEVLLSLADTKTVTQSSSDCIDVLVKQGDYIITEFVSIGQNLKLHGEGAVTVRFNFTAKFDPTQTNEPQYVLSFFNADRVELKGIDFIESPGIITIFSVITVLVEDCSFRYFFQGALDLYNCDFIRVVNSSFEHNGPTSIIKQDQYRGHAGGLSIGYNDIATNPVAVVSGCVFHNNTSDPTSDLVQTTSDLVQSSRFTGRGGGCAFPINPLYSLNATVEDCLFEQNYARSFGGGLYVAFNGREHHTVTLKRVQFIRNRAPTAGALEVGFVSGGNLGADNRLMAYDSEFVENNAVFGGGVYFFTLGTNVDSKGKLGNFASFENCTFIRNSAMEFGAAIGVSTLLYFRDFSSITPFQITSCSFVLNDAGGGGAMGVAYFPLAFSGNTMFQQNRGRTLVAMASRVEVRGSIHFTKNDGATIDGGAMYLTSLAQMVLSPGANITFNQNMGAIGAAVVGDTLFVPSVVSQLAFNPLCMVRYVDDMLPPDEWENVSMSFSGNEAVVSSAVYLTNLNLCSFVRLGYPWFNTTRTFRWNFVHFSNDNQNSAHYPDDKNPEWYVQTPADKIIITTANKSTFPGEVFSFGIEALDENNRQTSAVIRISDTDDFGDYIFDPAVITFDSIALGAVNTSFYRQEGASFSDSNLIVSLLLAESSQSGAFHVISVDCPPGYVLAPAPLDSGYETCSCNYNNDLILQCNGRDILIKTGYWGTLGESNDRLFLYPCPPGYCRCEMREMGSSVDCINIFNSAEAGSDSQCNCDRQDELCGKCRDGKGVSVLLNKCTTCSDASSLLIITLIVIDAGIIIFLLVIMKPFPSWLYPFVFYIQILPYLTMHFPLTFSKIQPYLYYISSALSFYFIYDFCLYSDMSPLVSYFLRFLPLFTVVIIAFAVLSIRRYRRKHALSWHGLWWIVLLMYTHIVHTSMSILNCPILPGRDGSHVPRWYIDGTVKCFTGGHAALGLLSILILALCVAIIPLSLAYITAKLRRPWVFRRSFEPLVIPFKVQYKWWSSVELGRRIILVLFIVSFPQNEYPAIFVLMITAAVYGYLQPFKHQAVNILETALSINTLILLLLRNTESIEDDLSSLGTQPSHNNMTLCQDEVDGLTDFASLLLPVYYLPLVALCTVCSVWIVLKGRHYYVTRQGTVEETIPEEHPVAAQCHGISEFYLNNEQRSNSTGEMAMVCYKSTQLPESKN